MNKIPSLFQIIAWRRPDDKPLSEAMLISLLTHKCVTRPQWVNNQASQYTSMNTLKYTDTGKFFISVLPTVYSLLSRHCAIQPLCPMLLVWYWNQARWYMVFCLNLDGNCNHIYGLYRMFCLIWIGLITNNRRKNVKRIRQWGNENG